MSTISLEISLRNHVYFGHKPTCERFVERRIVYWARSISFMTTEMNVCNHCLNSRFEYTQVKVFKMTELRIYSFTFAEI